MKLRKHMLLIAAIFVLATTIWWMTSGDQALQREKSSSDAGTKAPKKLTGSVARKQPVEPMKAVTPEEQSGKIRKLIGKLSKRVTFYGIVQDEQGLPVPDVRVSYHVRKPSMLDLDKEVRGRTMSGQDGMFTIDEGLGHQLVIDRVYKKGYRFDYKSSYVFATFRSSVKEYQSNQATPEVIRAWTIDPNVRVLTGKGRITPVQDGRNHILSIPSPGEEISLRITVTPDPNDRPPVGDWKFELELPHGGIQLADGNGMQVAMKDGYQSLIRKKFVKGRRGWRVGYKATYYFRTSSGYYGKLAINIICGIIDNNRASVSYYYWLNDGGGRSLATNVTRFKGYPNK